MTLNLGIVIGWIHHGALVNCFTEDGLDCDSAFLLCMSENDTNRQERL